MIYLIDRVFRNNNALNILVNQGKYPGIYNECFCLVCNVNEEHKFNDNDKDNDNVNVSDNDNDNDLRSSFINNDNDNDNVNDNDRGSSFAKKNNVNDNDNVNDNFIYLMKNIKGLNLTKKNIREPTPSSRTKQLH